MLGGRREENGPKMIENEKKKKRKEKGKSSKEEESQAEGRDKEMEPRVILNQIQREKNRGTFSTEAGPVVGSVRAEAGYQMIKPKWHLGRSSTEGEANSGSLEFWRNQQCSRGVTAGSRDGRADIINAAAPGLRRSK